MQFLKLLKQFFFVSLLCSVLFCFGSDYRSPIRNSADQKFAESKCNFYKGLACGGILVGSLWYYGSELPQTYGRLLTETGVALGGIRYLGKSFVSFANGVSLSHEATAEERKKRNEKRTAEWEKRNEENRLMWQEIDTERSRASSYAKEMEREVFNSKRQNANNEKNGRFKEDLD